MFVITAHLVPEPPERLAGPDRVARGVPNSGGDDEGIAGVLVEQFIRFDVKRV